MVNTPVMQPFTELVKIIRAPKKIKRSDYTDHFDGAIPVVDQGGGLIGGYTEDTEALLREPDPVVVFGDHTCRFKYVDFPFAAGADGTQIFKGIEGVNTRYLYYACSVVGVDLYGYQRHFKHLKASFIPVHEGSVQLKITQILSAYDDLIENNTRRIEILEEMARRLYEEWFVYFRFPGHEDVSFKKSAIGEIPEGWEVASLESFGTILTGKTPSKKNPELFGSEVPFIKLPDMHGQTFIVETNEGLSREGEESQRKKTVPANSICVSCIGTGGIVVITSEPSQTNQQINTVVPARGDLREFLYFSALSLRDDINNYGATGATMTNLSRGKFASLKVIAPGEKILSSYSKLTAPMFDRILNLQRENRNLRAQRDLLLPKLVSGEIDVSDIPMPEDKEVEAA